MIDPLQESVIDIFERLLYNEDGPPTRDTQLQAEQEVYKLVEEYSKKFAKKCIQELVDYRSNSVFMDGSCSVDPDSYKFRKIMFELFPSYRARIGTDVMEEVCQKVFKIVKENK